MSEAHDEFYLRYYVGHHTDQFGHEFMEIELTPSGKLRYANYSNYNSDILIQKEVYVSPAVVEEIRRIVEESKISSVDDSSWVKPEWKARRQELEIKIGNEHLAFTHAEIGSLLDVQKSADPEGLRRFYYLAQDLKRLVLSLISLHFKVRPIP